MTSKREPLTPEEQEANMRQEQWLESERRLDETLTRREVVEALQDVAGLYGCNGDHDSDLISNAFKCLAEVLS